MKNLLPYIILHGGATTSNGYDIVELKGGYAVGTVGLQLDMKTCNATILQSKIEILKELKAENDYIGYWIDNDILYIDIVKVIENFDKAVTVAKVFNQYAIWNNTFGMEVKINYATDGKSFAELKKESKKY